MFEGEIQENERFHPSAKAGGFPAPESNKTAPDCSACEDRAQRDALLLDALQTVYRVLNGTDGIKSPWMKLARIKAAVDEMLRLMQPETW